MNLNPDIVNNKGTRPAPIKLFPVSVAIKIDIGVLFLSSSLYAIRQPGGRRGGFGSPGSRRAPRRRR